MLRTCAAPDAVRARRIPATACCQRSRRRPAGDRREPRPCCSPPASGPLVLSRSAWTACRRPVARPTAPTPAADRPASLFVATWPTPIAATWSTIPRFALVDLGDRRRPTIPAPCVELGRGRGASSRSRWWSGVRRRSTTTDVCTQPCDTDPREPDKAQTSAAYLELERRDPGRDHRRRRSRSLQGLRFDVRPEGPELDGVVGAGALGPRAGRDRLRLPLAAARCLLLRGGRAPRRRAGRRPAARACPIGDAQHCCFGLPAHGLPATARADVPVVGLPSHYGSQAVIELTAVFGPTARERRARLGYMMAPMRLSPPPRWAWRPAAPTARAAAGRVRVAIPEFQLEGAPPPALGIQLQDGFVLGLVRAGVQVLDPDRHGEEAGGTSRAAALRRLAVPESRRPAARRRLHRAGQSRDRGQQLQERRTAVLDRGRRPRSAADRDRVEELRRVHGCGGARRDAAPCRRASRTHRGAGAPPRRCRCRRRRPLLLRGCSDPSWSRWRAPSRSAPGSRCWRRTAACSGTACDENRTRNAAGGVLIGAGAALTIGGAYVTIVRSRGSEPVTGFALALRW